MTRNLTERQRTILDRLSDDPRVSVVSLSEQLGVSAVTVRSDLDRLADSGQIIRTRGGGVAAFHPAIVARRRARVREKRRIAKAAATRIADGDNVMISAGTTTALIAQHLFGKRDVHVVTNSTLLFPAARANPSVRITLVGGEFRASAEAVVGPLALRSLEQFHVQAAFVGSDGFSLGKGITAHLVDVAEVVRTMAEQAERTIVVADSSKYGRAGFAHILPVTAVDTIITDRGLSDDGRRELEDHGIAVLAV